MFVLIMFYQQAGAWPLGQANLTSFVLPQELVKSVQMVSTLNSFII